MPHLPPQHPATSTRPEVGAERTVGGIPRKHLVAVGGSLLVVLVVAVVAVVVSGGRPSSANAASVTAVPADRCYSAVMQALALDLQTGVDDRGMSPGMRALIQRSGTSSTEFQAYTEVFGLAFNSALQHGTARGLADVQADVHRRCGQAR